jgi:hypothetical protein
VPVNPTPWSRLRANGLAIGAVLAVLTGPAVVAALPAAPAAATTSASSLWSHALAAAGKEPSVHYIQVSNGAGQTVTITGDVNRVAGSQRITFASAHQHGSATVTLVGNTTYVNGDSYGLALTLGMPQSLGSQLSGQWISVTPSAPNGLFKSTAAELSMTSVISNFAMKGPYSAGDHVKVSGVNVVKVHGFMSGTGKTKVPQTFAVRATGQPLPVSSVSVTKGKHNARVTTTYSKWGETVSVEAPTGAIPISQLLQGGAGGPVTPGGPGSTTTTTTPQIVTAATTSISTAPPRGSAATPTADRV